MSIQKPAYCAQNWLAMKEVPGGRICSACEKKIVDFTGKSWREIESLQKENNNALCGMYSQRQLDHWGHQAPSVGMNAKAVAAVSSLLLSIGSPVAAKALSHNWIVQTDTVGTPDFAFPLNADTTSCCTYVFEGVVSDTNGEPVPFVNVLIQELNVGTVSDFDGVFRLEIQCTPERMATQVIEAQIIGYQQYQIKLGPLAQGTHTLNIQLFQELEATAFYVTVLKPRQRFWQKITRPFRRKH